MNDKIDLKNHLKTVHGISPQSIASAATVTGTGVNMQDTGSEILCLVHVGAIGASSGGTLKLQESANDNTADVFAAADAYTDITGATVTFADTVDDNTVMTFTSNRRAKKFVRATVTTTGATAVLVGCTFHAIKHKM